jgi:ABC-type sulfate transport system permease component
VLTVRMMSSGVFTGLFMGAGILLVNAFGDASAGLVSIVFAVPGTVAGIVLLMLKARETKDTALESIPGEG